MKKEIAMKWVEALRSGKYRQGRGELRTKDNRFCCLGVLCEITKDKTNVDWSWPSDLYDPLCFDGKYTALPESVRVLAGMKSISGDLSETKCLASLNDAGMSFKEIADLIEKEYEGL